MASLTTVKPALEQEDGRQPTSFQHTPCNEVVTASSHRPAGVAIEGRAIMAVDRNDADVRLTQQICRPCRPGCLNEASSCFRTGPGKSEVGGRA